MKNVIWIQTISYRPESGACANRIYSFAKEFLSQDWEVNILTIGKKNEKLLLGGVNVYYLKNRFHYKNKNTINRLFDNLTFLRCTNKFISKNKNIIKDTFFMCSSPELISSLSGLKAKKNGAYFIFDIRDIWPEVGVEMGIYSKKSIYFRVFNKISNKLYKKCNLLTTVSEGKCNYLKEKTKQNCLLITNGFDFDDLNLEPDYSKLKNIQLNKYVISYVGNVGKAQGLINLIHAFQSLNEKKYTLIIGGVGADLIFLKEYCSNNNLNNIHFLGKLLKAEAKAVTLKSSFVYIPLLNDNMLDSVPTKLFECLAYGSPVLLASSGESADILNLTGYGINIKARESQDSDYLRKIIMNIVENHDILKNKENAFLVISNKYNRSKASHDLYLHLSELCKNN